MNGADAVTAAAAALPPDSLIVACNGAIGRALYAHADAPTRFYMVGSMGLAASIGLGLALARPARLVAVFDGDGNLLMGLGALANVGAAAPPNFLHLVFDNGEHASTGGQRTVADCVPLEAVAQAAGYRQVTRVRALPDLRAGVPAMLAAPGPSLLLAEIERGRQAGIGRVGPAPPAITARFRATVCGPRSS